MIFDEHRTPEQAVVDDCVHCGFCLPSCPTYALWAQEADSGKSVLPSESGEDLTANTPDLGTGNFTRSPFHVSVAVREGYDDNVYTTTENPVDFAGGAEQDIRTFERVVGLLVDSGEADALLVTGYFGGYGTDAEREVAVALASAAERSRVPLVVHSLYPESAAALALASSGALVHLEIEPAVRALATLVQLAESAPPRGADHVRGAGGRGQAPLRAGVGEGAVRSGTEHLHARREKRARRGTPRCARAAPRPVARERSP